MLNKSIIFENLHIVQDFLAKLIRLNISEFLVKFARSDHNKSHIYANDYLCTESFDSVCAGCNFVEINATYFYFPHFSLLDDGIAPLYIHLNCNFVSYRKDRLRHI